MAITTELARTGHDIAIHYRTDAGAAEALRAQVRALDRRAHTLQADLATADIEATCAELLAATTTHLGHLDTLILNASSQEATPWLDLDATTWDRLYAGTLRHPAVLLHAAAEAMDRRRSPVIVVIGSIEGLRPAPAHAPYAVFKAALHHLVAAAAQELGPRGIRVVGVAPGLIDRPGLADDWSDGYQRWCRASALSRPVTPEEVAQVVAFLASPHASGITGVVIPVDAGWSAAPGW